MAVTHLYMDREREDTYDVFLSQPPAPGLILIENIEFHFKNRNMVFTLSPQNQICDANQHQNHQ